MAFKLADDVLRQGVSGVSELLTETGLINVDFAHIRHVMALGGGALMSIGTAEGEDKAMKALEKALHHPMLDEISLDSATGIIANFSGGEDLTFSEVAEALSFLHEQAGNATEIIPGVINDTNLSNRAQVILVVTGLGAVPIEQAIPGAESYLADLTAVRNYQLDRTALQTMHSSGQANKDQEKPNSYSTFRPGSALTSADLDVPAFLRKRAKSQYG